MIMIGGRNGNGALCARQPSVVFEIFFAFTSTQVTKMMINMMIGPLFPKRSNYILNWISLNQIKLKTIKWNKFSIWLNFKCSAVCGMNLRHVLLQHGLQLPPQAWITPILSRKSPNVSNQCLRILDHVSDLCTSHCFLWWLVFVCKYSF